MIANREPIEAIARKEHCPAILIILLPVRKVPGLQTIQNANVMIINV
jgi:hypothetical protein